MVILGGSRILRGAGVNDIWLLSLNRELNMLHSIVGSGNASLIKISPKSSEISNVVAEKISAISNCGKKISSWVTYRNINNDFVKEYMKDNQKTYDRLFRQEPVVLYLSLQKP